MDPRDQGREVVTELVKKFSENRAEYMRATYNETLLRVDFLNPFLEALGWDVENRKGVPQHLREVVHEDIVVIGDDDTSASKRPDYAFRLGTERIFFLEAKKPSVAIATSNTSAFQVRRYGWNARMPISILTNFDNLAIYDCSSRPLPTDNASVARIKVYRYTDYAEKFDEIYDQISREAVYSGRFDIIFSVDRLRAGTEPFDAFFLRQIERWRRSFAEDLIINNQTLNQDEINFLLQQLLNRIIFLRICEDRDLEKYETLKAVQSYQDLKKLFMSADQRYNAGLFNFIEDKLSLDIEISSDVLIQVFRELYFPESPYAFAVVEADVISEIYEIFLGKEVQIVSGERIKIVEKPEVVESSGIVSSPKYIVEAIVERTLGPVCQGKTPTELSHLRVADIACGSGTFLLAAYEYLLNYHLEWYLRDGAENHRDRVYEGAGGSWYLTLYEKQRILLNNIYGVDLDRQAAEVSQFSLFLKVLENETAASVKAHLDTHKIRALPNLSENIQWGNSLVDPDTYEQFDPDIITSSERFSKVAPFDWSQSFPHVMTEGGFDVIIGNPPYIRTQNMVKYSPQEVQYYKSQSSPYLTAKSDNFDKYALFIEKSLSLLKSSGSLGYIVPNKFFRTKAGASLRQLITSHRYLSEIVDFGVQQVFAGQTTTYTCILILRKAASKQVLVEHVTDLQKWRYGATPRSASYNPDDFGSTPWRLIPPEVADFFERLQTQNPLRLGEVYDIFVGLQTSDDEVYIRSPQEETANSVTFKDVTQRVWTIEKAIMRPCIYDEPVPAYATPKPNTYIIFPYHIEWVTLKNGKTVERAILYTQEEMQSQFPECWRYLNAHKNRLDPYAPDKVPGTRKSVQGYTPDTWYRYGRSQSLTKFDGQPKLIWSVLSLDARYAYDNGNILFTGGGNGPYYALRQEPSYSYSLFYVQAILHHPVFEAMIYSGAVRVRGDYSSRGKQFIADIPIRRIDFESKGDRKRYERVIELVQQLIAVTAQLSAAKLPRARQLLERQSNLLKRQINERITELYGIGEDDLRLVEDLKKMDAALEPVEKGETP
jgi:type I restriction-modification system DNA methylase subunit